MLKGLYSLGHESLQLPWGWDRHWLPLGCLLELADVTHILRCEVEVKISICLILKKPRLVISTLTLLTSKQPRISNNWKIIWKNLYFCRSKFGSLEKDYPQNSQKKVVILVSSTLQMLSCKYSTFYLCVHFSFTPVVV